MGYRRLASWPGGNGRGYGTAGPAASAQAPSGGSPSLGSPPSEWLSPAVPSLGSLPSEWLSLASPSLASPSLASSPLGSLSSDPPAAGWGFCSLLSDSRSEMSKSGAALDESVRVVEVVGRGQQVGVGPDLVPAADAAGLGQATPDGRGLAQPPRAQLKADQRGERALGRAAGGPAPPDRLGQGVGLRQPVCRPPRRPRSRPSLRPARARSPAGPARPSALGCPRAGTARRRTAPRSAPPGWTGRSAASRRAARRRRP